jgi:hypothetical protein
MIPHPEDPIALEAFDRFDQAIAEVNADLGIGNRDGFYASSPARDDGPELTVARYESPNDLRTITIGIIAVDLTSITMARNDCGTQLRPKQVAGLCDSRGSDELPREFGKNVSANEFEDLHELVSRRIEDGSFVRKRHIPLIPTVFLAR